MLRYFELQEGTSSKFWEISLNVNTITTRYGKIGSQGKTTQKDFEDPVKAQQEYDKLVKEKTGNGYHEIIRDGKTLLPGDYTIISEKEAVKKYKLDEYIDALYDDGGKYMLYKGDVVFNGTLDTYKHCSAAKDDIYGIIIEGNLTVKGVIFQPDMDNGEHLLVTGNVYAQSINKGGGEFYIKGDLTAEQTIYGYYNHGALTVEGKTQAVAILADDQFFRFLGEVSGTIVGDQEIEGAEDAEYSEITVLRPELIKEEEYANSDKISNYINKGKHILRDEFLPGFNNTQVAGTHKETATSAKPGKLTLKEAKAEKVVRQALERMKVSPAEVQVLDISYQDLEAFPMLLTTLKSLKQLKLNGNEIKTLPAEIAELEHLEELHLSGCALKTLPDQLTQLKKLQVLDLSQNYDLQLPKSLAQLASLRVLDISECRGFLLTTGMPGLEELRYNSYAADGPVDFPEAVLGCTGLKRLFMNSNSLKQIPPALTALKELEELYLDGSLGYVNEFPDLSGLKKLKILHASGICNNSESPLAKHSLLKDIFRITSLEELKIDLYRKWLEDLSKETFKDMAKNLSHDSGRLKEISDLQAEKVEAGDGKKKKIGYLRKPLTAAHLEGIGALTQLRILDLGENMLSDLPEEVYSLPNLRSLNLKGNSFKISDRLKIAERLPEVELDLRENWTEKEIIDTEAARLWKETADLIEKGNELWIAEKPIKSIAIFDQVLANFNDGKVVDKYLQLYTYYTKANACNNLPADAAYKKMPAEKKREYSLLCIETGLTALSLLPEHILHSTSMGDFYRDVIRRSGNAVAWAMYEVYEDREKMEEALAMVNRAAEYIVGDDEYYIYNTQVRILLRLGRQEEAWQIVKQTLEKDEFFESFDDIVETKEYKKWLKK